MICILLSISLSYWYRNLAVVSLYQPLYLKMHLMFELLFLFLKLHICIAKCKQCISTKVLFGCCWCFVKEKRGWNQKRKNCVKYYTDIFCVNCKFKMRWSSLNLLLLLQTNSIIFWLIIHYLNILIYKSYLP